MSDSEHSLYYLGLSNSVIFRRKLQLYSTVMATKEAENKLQSIFNTLDSQFPGLELRNLPQRLKDAEKLATLAKCIQYKLPKLFYPPRIAQFEEELFEDYASKFIYGSIDDREEFREMISLSADQHKQIEADNILNQQSQSEEKPIKNSIKTIQEVTAFMLSFNADQNKKAASQELIHKVQIFSQKKVEHCVIDLSQITQNLKNKRFSENAKIGFNDRKKSDKWDKKNYVETKQSHDGIVIELGTNISLQTKMMRAEVHRLSATSFSVISQQKQKQMSNIEQIKLDISFLINRVTNQTIQDFFNEIRQFITKDQILCQYFLNKMIESCFQSLPQAIQVLAKLITSITEISQRQFKWDIVKTSTKKNINSFHWMLGNLFQDKFTKCFGNITQSPKQLINLCIMIAHLVKDKKFSKKIFLDIINKILEGIIQKKEKVQYHFEALIAMITVFGSTFKEVSHKLMLPRQISPDLQQKILKITSEKQIPGNLIELLSKIDNSLQTETKRIQCLLINLHKRLNKEDNSSVNQPIQQEKINHTFINEPIQQEKVEEIIIQCNIKKFITLELMNDDPNIEELKRIYNIPENKLNVFEILMRMSYDGDRSQNNRNIETIKDAIQINDENVENFKLVWKQLYTNFYIEECDYPYMVETLAQLISHFLPNQYNKCRVQLHEDDLDYEDCQFFMNKLFGKLQYYAGVDV